MTVLGLQTASAIYPCPYCLVSLRQLREQDDEEFGEDQPGEEDKAYQERTFGVLSKDHSSFLEMGGKVSDEEPEDIRVIGIVPLPELYRMEGVTNHLFYGKGGLVDLVGRDKAMEWAIKNNVVSVGYHGEKFEGPECRKLLKNSDHLLCR